jgi:hypothetical protein
MHKGSILDRYDMDAYDPNVRNFFEPARRCREQSHLPIVVWVDFGCTVACIDNIDAIEFGTLEVEKPTYNEEYRKGDYLSVLLKMSRVNSTCHFELYDADGSLATRSSDTEYDTERPSSRCSYGYEYGHTCRIPIDESFQFQRGGSYQLHITCSKKYNRDKKLKLIRDIFVFE